MQAIELPARISPQHELHLKLPEDTATGPARVIILFDSPAPRADRPGNLEGFLGRLPRNPAGGLSRELVGWGDEGTPTNRVRTPNRRLPPCHASA